VFGAGNKYTACDSILWVRCEFQEGRTSLALQVTLSHVETFKPLNARYRFVDNQKPLITGSQKSPCSVAAVSLCEPVDRHHSAIVLPESVAAVTVSPSQQLKRELM
jgi:hypothetical protein